MKRIPREEIAEKQDKVRRHNIALMKLLAELHPVEFKEIASGLPEKNRVDMGLSVVG